MASSRKPRSGRRRLAHSARRVAVALSGGVDSVVLLHQMRAVPGLRALHVHHGLSPNADAWASFCRKLCKRLGIPLAIRKVKVVRRGEGLEAAARAARYAVFSKLDTEVIALAHNRDDQAETVLMNLLRGAGARGASGMSSAMKFKGKTLLRPLLGTPRKAIEAYARAHKLQWVEDESNADESLTRNFLRRRVTPVLDQRFPAWKKAVARAARHFSRKEAGANELLRQFLHSKGLRAPSEARLVEMLKQLTSRGARTLIAHDGARLRVYRGKVSVEPPSFAVSFTALQWKGEARLEIPALGGELRFRTVRGQGFSKELSKKAMTIRLRRGGERLQPDPRRPRRTLKNLFQEAGVPPWERDRLPLIARGADLVWVPGLGVDVRYQAAENAPGVMPEWRKMAG